MGNSVKGIMCCNEFTRLTKLKYHLFSNHKQITTEDEQIYKVISSASKGHVEKIVDISDMHILNGSDYDGRTALHLACSEGRVQIVKLLVERELRKNVKDRWGNTPLDELENLESKILN